MCFQAVQSSHSVCSFGSRARRREIDFFPPRQSMKRRLSAKCSAFRMGRCVSMISTQQHSTTITRNPNGCRALSPLSCPSLAFSSQQIQSSCLQGAKNRCENLSHAHNHACTQSKYMYGLMNAPEDASVLHFSIAPLSAMN